jgi:sugar (pentulose or hexulose) kinase
VSNVAINVPENPQVPCVGCAVLAAVAAGEYDSIEEATAKMVRFNRRIVPNKDKHEIYQKIFAQYKKAYIQFGDWMRETSNLMLSDEIKIKK